MKQAMNYVAGGAALGAVVGALAGLVYQRREQSKTPAGESALVAGQPLDTSRLLKLGLAVIALVRQVMELG
jgi:hypothetical protein